MATPQRTDVLMRALAALRPPAWELLLNELDRDVVQLLRDVEAADILPYAIHRHAFFGDALPQNWIQLVLEDRWPQMEVEVIADFPSSLLRVVMRLRSRVVQ